MATKIRVIKLTRKQKEQLDAYTAGWEFGQLSELPAPKLTKKQSKAMPSCIDGNRFSNFEKICFLAYGYSDAFGEIEKNNACCVTYHIDEKGWLIRERWYNDNDVRRGYVFTSDVKFKSMA